MSAAIQAQISPSHSSSAAGRLNLGHLDGLRAVAALSVVLHHCLSTIWSDGSHPAPLWASLIFFGHAVPVFIVLSGFCLMLPVVRGDGSLRGGAAAFFKKRARRILPVYYVAISFSLLLDFFLLGKKTGGIWDNTLPVTWKSIGIHLLLLQNFSLREFSTINYALWSLSLEWWIYFLFPPLVWAWKRFGAGRTTAASVTASFVLWQVCIYKFHEAFSLHYIAMFVLGMLGCELAYSARPVARLFRDRCPWKAIAWTAAGLLLLASSGAVRQFSSDHVVELLVGLLTLCLLVTMSTRPDSLAKRALSYRPLIFLGSFAYSLYLVHAPLIAVIWQGGLHPLHLASVAAFLLLLLVGVPVIVAGAYLFHLAFERPFMSKPPPKTEKQAEVAAITNPAP